MIPGLEDLMRQAQQMSQRMQQMKQDLASQTVEGSAGGGMVVAVVNGAGQLQRIDIEPEAIDPAEREMLQDLVVAAVNQAQGAARELVAEKTRELTGGVPLPGIENLFGGLGP
jgi:hypothetical protein